MKRLGALLLLLTTTAFALPTFYGTRGTNFVSSGLCENMGFLWFNIASEGYKEHVVFQDSSGAISDSFNILAAKPAVSLGFTPWHYLEFSVYGNGYFYSNEAPAATAMGLLDVGGHVKGSIPLTPIDDDTKPVKMGLGIDGFFLMSLPFQLNAANNQAMEQYLGYYPFESSGPEFGGRLMFSSESKFISAHVNAGYWYRSAHHFDDSIVQYPQTVISGVGLESNPLPWLNPFVDFNLNYGLNMGNPDTRLTGLSTHASAGLRFPIMMGKNKGFGLLLTLAGGADPMNFGSTMSAYAGLAIGGDLIPTRERFLRGIVVNEETEEPIKGAVITIAGPDRDSVIQLTTDSLGAFSISEKALMDTDSFYVTAEEYYPETITPEEIEAHKAALNKKDAIPLQMQLPPIKESWIAGVISDAKSMEPLKATVTFNEINTGDILGPIASDAVTGYFRTKIEPGDYNMLTKVEGYKDNQQTVKVELGQDTIIDVFMYAMEVEKPAPPPPPKKLEPVTITGYGRGQRRLLPNQIRMLEDVAETLKENSDATVVITGHTDSVGPNSSNMGIGMARARAVFDFLLMRGIDARRMTVKTASEHNPIGDNRYRSGRRMNRRVELHFSRNNGKTTPENNNNGRPPRERIK